MVVFSYYPADPRPRREAEALVSAGIAVDIICLRNDDEAKKELVNGVQVYRLPVERKRGGKIRYFWEYGIFIVFSFFFLSFLHVKKKYNILHAHNMPDVLVFSTLLPKLFGAKVILDLHDPMPEVFQAKYDMPITHPVIRILLFLEKISIVFADLILTPNIAFRDLFVSRSCPQEKIQIVMNSPDTAIFRSHNGSKQSEDKDATSDHFVLMYHGTVVERNGLDTALYATAALKEKISNLVFHVYGDGDFVPRFLELVEELGLQNVVKYHGFVPLEVIAKAIEGIDVGLIPNKRSSFTEINMPTRIFEYLSMGKPVISPNTRGIRDYFSDRELPFFEPGDVQSLEDCIVEIYEKPALREQFLTLGEKIYLCHRWELQSKELVKYVTKLMKK